VEKEEDGDKLLRALVKAWWKLLRGEIRNFKINGKETLWIGLSVNIFTFADNAYHAWNNTSGH
jgi:hypothetical protein